MYIPKKTRNKKARHIVEHHFSFTTPYYKDKPYKREIFDSRKHLSFYNNNHPLEFYYKKIFEMIPYVGKTDDPYLEIVRLVNQMYWDFWNNGGGNSGRWAIANDFKKAIRNINTSKDIVLSLERRLSEVYLYLGKGKNFGSVRYGCESQILEALEKLLTDVVYYSSKYFYPNEIEKLEKEIKEPYQI